MDRKESVVLKWVSTVDTAQQAARDQRQPAEGGRVTSTAGTRCRPSTVRAHYPQSTGTFFFFFFFFFLPVYVNHSLQPLSVPGTRCISTTVRSHCRYPVYVSCSHCRYPVYVSCSHCRYPVYASCSHCRYPVYVSCSHCRYPVRQLQSLPVPGVRQPVTAGTRCTSASHCRYPVYVSQSLPVPGVRQPQRTKRRRQFVEAADLTPVSMSAACLLKLSGCGVAEPLPHGTYKTITDT